MAKTKSAKVVFINAKERKVEIKTVTDLSSMQALVGGYIKPARLTKAERDADDYKTRKRCED